MFINSLSLISKQKLFINKYLYNNQLDLNIGGYMFLFKLNMYVCIYLFIFMCLFIISIFVWGGVVFIIQRLLNYILTDYLSTTVEINTIIN